MTNRRGVTLLEVSIAAAILAALVALAYLLLASGSSTYAQSAAQSALEEAARRAVEDMSRELRVADAASVSISRYRGCDRIDFAVPHAGPDGEAGARALVQFRYEPAGGRIVRQEGTALRTLCGSAGPGSLVFLRAGDTVRITLRISGTDGEGRAHRTEVSTSVTLRNRSDR